MGRSIAALGADEPDQAGDGVASGDEEVEPQPECTKPGPTWSPFAGGLGKLAGTAAKKVTTAADTGLRSG